MDDVIREVRSRSPNSRIVFVSGNFNVVHPGHLRLLQFAKECGDVLVVGVHDQSSPGATLPEAMRLESVRAIGVVNHAFILREPPESFIARLRPAVVVKGREFESRDNPEQAAVNSYGGRLLFGSGEVRFSSLNLLQREYFETDFSAIRKTREFPDRHGFSISDLKKPLSAFVKLRVMVIGDLIVDEYINCDPLGMSREDPSIVVTPVERHEFVGGAGIVAAHAASLGAKVRFISVSGVDSAGAFAKETLEGYQVNNLVFSDESRPTTLKQRYRAAGKTLLRVSYLRQHEIHHAIATSVFDAVVDHIDETDLIIFSDFNYGCLPQMLVDQIIAVGKAKGVMMVADSQASSQVSDVSRYHGMALLTPTEREARLALRDSSSGLAVIAEALRRKAEARNVVVTLGSEGILIHAQNKSEWATDQLPSFNGSPKDPAGAGDSFLCCASMALCSGAGIWESVYLGSLAAACQVARVGNTPLKPKDLLTEIDLP